jgi:hypothetical protein
VSLDGCLRAGGGGFATVIWWCSLMVHRGDFNGKKQAVRSIPLSVQMITVPCVAGQEKKG